jgi:hypothetical protein
VTCRRQAPATTAAKRRAAPLGLAALALPLLVLVPGVALIAWHGFAGLYGQDSFGYVGYALGPLREALGNVQLPPDFAWPPGYPLVVAVVAAFGLGPAAGQLVSLVAGALVPVLVFLLARDVAAPYAGRSVGAVALLAGAIAGLSGQLLQSSVVAMSDTPALAAATLGAFASCRYVALGKRRWLVVAAAAVAFAIEVRWVYGLVALPLAAQVLVRIGRDARADPRAGITGVALAAAVGLTVLSPTWAPMLLALWEGAQVPFATDFSSYRGWNLLGAASSTFETADGLLRYGLPTGLFYLLQPLQPYWFFALGLLIVPGAAVASDGTMIAVAR